MQACRLTARNLACRRGERVLFSGVSLALEPGAAVQVIGANGIGKSSLLRILAGLMPAWAGEVARDGPIGLIDGNAALDPGLPLGKALAFWQRLDSESDNAATRLGLAHLLDVPVRYLSTGQTRRAAFARLIGQRAAIWLHVYMRRRPHLRQVLIQRYREAIGTHVRIKKANANRQANLAGIGQALGDMASCFSDRA